MGLGFEAQSLQVRILGLTPAQAMLLVSVLVCVIRKSDVWSNGATISQAKLRLHTWLHTWKMGRQVALDSKPGEIEHIIYDTYMYL